jgi:uncharacterized protein YjbJ (UPF0337 family)
VFGTRFAFLSDSFTERVDMADEDVMAGKVKQVKGKANDIAGAVTGDTAQQIKGKVQKVVGKIQEGLGKATQPGRPIDE